MSSYGFLREIPALVIVDTGYFMGKRKNRKKKTRERIETDTVIDLDAQREARRRQLREAAAESRRRRGAREDEPESDYYGYRSDAAEPMVEDTKKSRKSVKKRKKGLTPGRAIILVAVLFIVICVFCSIWKIISLKVEEREKTELIKELEAQKQELEQEVGKIGTEEYIEEQARRWLKMAKSGEIIYVFGDDGDTGA